MSKKEPRLTGNTFRVLDALITEPDIAGADIARKTGLKTGTLYPILMRLEDAGWLKSVWEEGTASAMGRPRRRLYKVTGVGAAHAAGYRREQQEAFGRLAW